jgi:hypothetical protein
MATLSRYDFASLVADQKKLPPQFSENSNK